MNSRSPSKGRIGRLLTVMLILGFLMAAGGCKSLFLAKGYPSYDGELRGLPVHAPVKVLRDGYGIPHIYAQDRHDLLLAQGYVHAQDRLWQMETIRRLCAGRLAEVAGEARLNLDYFARLAGFPELRSRALRALRQDEVEQIQAYVDGINAYIRLRSDNLPLEFRSAKFKPEDWTVEDACSFVVLNSWGFQENFRAELMVLQGRKSVSVQDWKDIFPGHAGAVLPDDAYFERLRSWKVGPLHKSALAFFQAVPDQVSMGGGSNAWIIAAGPGGKPLFANDTHVGISVPGTWYLCHLNSPGIDIAGASAPGTPGVVIGHNEKVAWGLTVLPVDSLDLFMVRVDPQNPTRYFVGNEVLEMERQETVITLPGGKSRTMTVYRTIYGPVITALDNGIDAAVALRWYGTLKEGELEDLTMRSILGFMDCRSARDVIENARYTKIVGLNFLAADVEGNIGWHCAGAVPIRRGYSGRLPADGSAGTMSWEGFTRFDELPGALNPPEGRIANCNNRVVADDDPQQISNSWSAPYRFERALSLLGELASPTAEGFRRMQLDSYSLQAEKILPKLLAYSFKDPRAREAADILKSWDRQVLAGSKAAAVWEIFLTEWVRQLLGDELGDQLFYYFHIPFKKYLIQDVILDRPDSPLWDRKDTPQREGPQEILETSLSRTIRWLEDRLGSDRRSWSWGRLHTVYWKHPGGGSGLNALLLNSGPYPVDGDGTTLNSWAPMPARDEYYSFIIPNLRMVVSLADLDGMTMIAPLGQSGQPGHAHYDDMVGKFIKGESINLPVSPERVQATVVSTMVLTP
ncbi:MAG: penicillin acylase family protein [Spirochaetia bacterium]|jgi:penicillin amidase